MYLPYYAFNKTLFVKRLAVVTEIQVTSLLIDTAEHPIFLRILIFGQIESLFKCIVKTFAIFLVDDCCRVKA